jgi:hypothetical protein
LWFGILIHLLESLKDALSPHISCHTSHLMPARVKSAPGAERVLWLSLPSFKVSCRGGCREKQVIGDSAMVQRSHIKLLLQHRVYYVHVHSSMKFHNCSLLHGVISSPAIQSTVVYKSITRIFLGGGGEGSMMAGYWTYTITTRV